MGKSEYQQVAGAGFASAHRSGEGLQFMGFREALVFFLLERVFTPDHLWVWSRAVIEISGRLYSTETVPIEWCAAVSQVPIPLFLAVIHGYLTNHFLAFQRLA
jgi:hypothetical protein